MESLSGRKHLASITQPLISRGAGGCWLTMACGLFEQDERRPQVATLSVAIADRREIMRPWVECDSLISKKEAFLDSKRRPMGTIDEVGIIPRSAKKLPGISALSNAYAPVWHLISGQAATCIAANSLPLVSRRSKRRPPGKLKIGLLTCCTGWQ
jgi:hypothetical protein